MKDIIAKITGNREDFSVQHRIFNATIFFGITLTIISGISNYYMGLKPFTYIYPFLSCFLFVGFYFYSIFKRNLYIISRVSFAYIIFIYFPLNWFINGGSLGGFQYFSVFFLIILLTTMPGKNGVFLALYFFTIIAVLFLEYYFPELVYDYITRIDRYIDLIITYTLLYFAILIVLNIFLKLYKQANITLEKQKEEIRITGEKLEIANNELKEINKTKDKFFSIIAHDLRSPFNSMLGFSGMLDEHYDELNKEEQKEYIGIINGSIHSTFKLLENLLAWSNSQRGTINFNPEEINLFLLSVEIIELIQISAEKKSINIKSEIPKHIVIQADRYMFSTVLRNLLSNAIKFTPRNGEIIVKAQENKNGFIQVSVKDNGMGISKEVQSQLFDFSNNTSTKGTDNETGTGLGLILCEEFVVKHGGKIWVESEIDKGSTFYFTIPDKIY